MAQKDKSDSSDSLRNLCAKLFAEPNRYITIVRQPIDNQLLIDAHEHDDLLQCDLAIRCGGKWLFEDGELSPHGITAVTFYPYQNHGYQLAARRPNAMVFSLKIRIDRRWPAVKNRIFPTRTTQIPTGHALIRAAEQLWRLTIFSRQNAPMLMAKLVEVLCLWPGSPSGSPEAAHDPMLEPAYRLALNRPTDPPTVTEMAEAVDLSPRHFSRRFQAAYGITPHDHVSRCRVAHARELLLQGEMTVTQVSDALGFPSIHTFSRWFRQETGDTPSALRQTTASL